MNSEHVKDLLSPYLDDALAPEEQRIVAAHLGSCQECSAMLADFRRFDALLSQLPRISPTATLRAGIFSSPDYLELTSSTNVGQATVPQKRLHTSQTPRPQLVAFPGSRDRNVADSNRSSTVTREARALARRSRGRWGQQVLQAVIAATVLLTLGVGGFIGWNLWQRQNVASQNTNSINVPAGLQQGPIPAGTRFIFWRDGALWSAPTDGGTSVLRLTPLQTTIANNWTIRPPLAGHSAGNMLAYIDRQQGLIHTIRSDGQNDSIIQQPLLKPGTPLSSQWNSTVGVAILNGLAWSGDGNTLAFIADPGGTGQTALYLYTLATAQLQHVSLVGEVSHLVWSPDSVRLAFVLTHNGNVTIQDYNTQKQALLTLAPVATNVQINAGDTLLSLDWSSNKSVPTLTWSIGSTGHVQSIWTQRVGDTTGPVLLRAGDYVQATYSRSAYGAVGGWLLVATTTDFITVDLSSTVVKLASGKQINLARWSPDGASIDYIEGLTSATGTLHVLNTLTGVDTQIALNVAITPMPQWSADSQHLAYSTGKQVQMVDLHAPGTTHVLKPQGQIIALSWSASSSSQIILMLGDQGIYLLDTQQNTSQQLDKKAASGPILWTQIP